MRAISIAQPLNIDKVKFSLYLIKRHAMKTWREGRYSSIILDFGIR
jgi:hypothetical protein